MKTTRQLIERLSRGKLLKRRILVNNRNIPLYVSPDAQLKYLKPGSGAFDQDLIDIAEKYVTPSSNVWDVGANVGVFTFAASSVAVDGAVVSIEADIWLANILRKTTQLKEYTDSHISVLPVAVSNENSVASFVVAARGRASNALESAGGRSQMGGIREKQHVPTLTLDTILKSFPAPDFVKMDVEGAEYMAIQGATRIINEVRPIFYIEVGIDSSAQIFEIFRQANYGVFNQQGEPVDEARAYDNIFFIPTEKTKTNH